MRSAGFILLLFCLIRLRAVSFSKRQAALVCPSLSGFPLFSQSQPCLLLHHWVLVFGHVILWPSLNQKVGRLAAWGLPFIVCHGFSCQLDRNLELSRKRESPFKNCLNMTSPWVCLWGLSQLLINTGRKAPPTVGGAIPRQVDLGCLRKR